MLSLWFYLRFRLFLHLFTNQGLLFYLKIQVHLTHLRSFHLGNLQYLVNILILWLLAYYELAFLPLYDSHFVNRHRKRGVIVILGVDADMARIQCITHLVWAKRVFVWVDAANLVPASFLDGTNLDTINMEFIESVFKSMETWASFRQLDERGLFRSFLIGFLFLLRILFWTLIPCPASTSSLTMLVPSSSRLRNISSYLIWAVHGLILTVSLLIDDWLLVCFILFHHFKCCLHIFLAGKLVKEGLLGLLIPLGLIGWRYRKRVKLSQVADIESALKDKLDVWVKFEPVNGQDVRILSWRDNRFNFKITNVRLQKLFSTLESTKLKQAMWAIDPSDFRRVSSKFLLQLSAGTEICAIEKVFSFETLLYSDIGKPLYSWAEMFIFHVYFDPFLDKSHNHVLNGLILVLWGTLHKLFGHCQE